MSYVYSYTVWVNTIQSPYRIYRKCNVSLRCFIGLLKTSKLADMWLRSIFRCISTGKWTAIQRLRKRIHYMLIWYPTACKVAIYWKAIPFSHPIFLFQVCLAIAHYSHPADPQLLFGFEYLGRRYYGSSGIPNLHIFLTHLLWFAKCFDSQISQHLSRFNVIWFFNRQSIK